jgi:hypothetical protein
MAKAVRILKNMNLNFVDAPTQVQIAVQKMRFGELGLPKKP